ncbi:chemotaxis protein CheD [bacterium]|nr:chemotaxis protein CheD [bacterium]
MPEILPVGMAEMRISQPPDVLAVYGVGSCVIVAMYDPKTRIGGLAHIMLPCSSGVQTEKVNPKKFANTAIPLLFQTLAHAGVFRSNVWAKIVGGSEMFPPADGISNSVGKQNVEAVLKALDELGVPIIAKAVGGNSGRSVEFILSSGKMSVSILGEPPKEL